MRNKDLLKSTTHRFSPILSQVSPPVLFVTRQQDHNPSEYTNLYCNWEQQHVGSKVFRGPLGQWLPWAEPPVGSGVFPYNRSGVLPPILPIVTSVRYMSPGGHDIFSQAFRQGT